MESRDQVKHFFAAAKNRAAIIRFPQLEHGVESTCEVHFDSNVIQPQDLVHNIWGRHIVAWIEDALQPW